MLKKLVLFIKTTKQLPCTYYEKLGPVRVPHLDRDCQVIKPDTYYEILAFEQLCAVLFIIDIYWYLIICAQ